MKHTLKEKWLKTKTHLEYEILNIIKNIEEKYPTEVDELTHDNVNWYHGFNSGMLAAIRLFDGLMSEDEDAL